MNVYGGPSVRGGGGKERILRSEEDQRMLHIYRGRQCNESHQVLLARRGTRGGMEI
jgi:hypothetical protein